MVEIGHGVIIGRGWIGNNWLLKIHTTMKAAKQWMIYKRSEGREGGGGVEIKESKREKFYDILRHYMP